MYSNSHMKQRASEWCWHIFSLFYFFTILLYSNCVLCTTKKKKHKKKKQSWHTCRKNIAVRIFVDNSVEKFSHLFHGKFVGICVNYFIVLYMKRYTQEAAGFFFLVAINELLTERWKGIRKYGKNQYTIKIFQIMIDLRIERRT